MAANGRAPHPSAEFAEKIKVGPTTGLHYHYSKPTVLSWLCRLWVPPRHAGLITVLRVLGSIERPLVANSLRRRPILLSSLSSKNI